MAGMPNPTAELYREKARLAKTNDIVNELLKFYGEVEYRRAVDAAIKHVNSAKMTGADWAALARKKGHAPPSETVKDMVRKELAHRSCPVRPDGTEWDGLPKE